MGQGVDHLRALTERRGGIDRKPNVRMSELYAAYYQRRSWPLPLMLSLLYQVEDTSLMQA